MLVHDGTIMQRICWLGVLPGSFLGPVMLISLNLLGLAIGLRSVTNPFDSSVSTFTPEFGWVIRIQMRAGLHGVSRTLVDTTL
jgi:hypothetical protein